MPRPPAATAPRSASRGSIRPAGLAAATFTAAAVFVLGVLILPPIETEEPAPPPPPPPAPVAPPPPPPPPPAPDALGLDATSADGAATQPAAPSTPAPEKPVAEVPAAAPVPTPKTKAAAVVPDAGRPAPAEAKAEPTEPKAASAARDKSPDKEVAREAWRKNLPDITGEPGKAAMIIPIKGSIEGATYHVTTKPKSVLVTLPKGESMITMPFYNLRRDGYRQLWIKKDDATGTTTLRIVLGEASDPQVEIKDDFVRVVVRRPVEAAPSAAPEAATPAPAEPAAVPSPSPARD